MSEQFIAQFTREEALPHAGRHDHPGRGGRRGRRLLHARVESHPELNRELCQSLQECRREGREREGVILRRHRLGGCRAASLPHAAVEAGELPEAGVPRPKQWSKTRFTSPEHWFKLTRQGK